jgi:hypothetical protein
MVQAEEKPNQLLTALSSTTISGYVDTSAHWTLGTGNANPPGYAYNTPSKQDGFNLNVVDVTIEKPLDEGTWSAGYKVELWLGPNAVRFNTSSPSGFGPSQVPGPAAASDLSLKQAYVALRIPVQNGIDVKLGTFDTIIGYEVANAGSDPNYTRSYGYTIEPTQHTGLLASYQINKLVGISAGIANTWSAGINNRTLRAESSKAYMTAMTFTAPDDWGFLAGSTLGAGLVDGYNTLIGNDVTSYYIGGTINTPWKAVKLGASWDYAHAHDNSFGPTGYAQAAALYASVTPPDSKFSFHVRGEWFDITDGYATGGKFNGTGPLALGNVGGIPSEVIAITGTLQYDLWANVLSRLELRWDHATTGSRPFGGTVGGSGIPGGAGKKNEVLIAANVIYKF